MFRPCMAARLLLLVWSLSEQSSYAGSGSPITVPTPSASGEWTVEGSGVSVCHDVLGSTETTPWVSPETRFSAPGVDGPYTVLNDLSFRA
jgi:hypothetical protein